MDFAVTDGRTNDLMKIGNVCGSRCNGIYFTAYHTSQTLKQFSLMSHEKTTWGEANKQFFHILNDMAAINLIKMTLTPFN